MTGHTVSWFHRDPALSNQHCLYCGAFVGRGAPHPTDKEHMIGRNFVPVGSLGNHGFNFIFRACRECNDLKAAAERHVSSVTLVNCPARTVDRSVDDAARRKAARDFHPDKRGVPVGEATDQHWVAFNLGVLSMKFELISPPQVNSDAAELLAFNQIQALFSLATTMDYRVPERMRLLPHTHFRYLGHYGHQDWGNPHLVEVSRRVSDWSCRASIATADGYFKAILKRHEVKGWFCALEWNQHLRAVCAIVREDEPASIFEDLPALDWKVLPDGSRVRVEVPLGGDADPLFDGDVIDSQ